MRAEETQDAYRKELDASRKPDAAAAQQVQQRLDELIERLVRVLDAMGEIGTINQLIIQLREIEKQEQDIGGILKKMQADKQKGILDILDKIGG